MGRRSQNMSMEDLKKMQEQMFAQARIRSNSMDASAGAGGV